MISCSTTRLLKELSLRLFLNASNHYNHAALEHTGSALASRHSVLWLMNTDYKSSAVAEMGDRLATIDKGQKVRGCAPLGGAGYPSNTMWLGPRLTSVPSGILIDPAIWPQYQHHRQTGHTNKTEQTDRKQTNSIGLNVLETVAQKCWQMIVPSHRRTTYGGRAFAVAGPSTWNSLPKRLRDPSSSSAVFARLLKTFLFSEY